MEHPYLQSAMKNIEKLPHWSHTQELQLQTLTFFFSVRFRKNRKPRLGSTVLLAQFTVPSFPPVFSTCEFIKITREPSARAGRPTWCNTRHAAEPAPRVHP